MHGTFSRFTSQSRVLEADTALVVVDAQREYCKGVENQDEVDKALNVIKKARLYFEKRSLPSFLLYFSSEARPEVAYKDKRDGLYRQRLSGIFEIVRKTTSSAFDNDRDLMRFAPETSLAKTLCEDYPKVKNLVWTGFNRRACVYRSLRDASKHLHFKNYLLDDASEDGETFGVYNLTREQADSYLRHYGVWIGTFEAYKALRA